MLRRAIGRVCESCALGCVHTDWSRRTSPGGRLTPSALLLSHILVLTAGLRPPPLPRMTIPSAPLTLGPGVAVYAAYEIARGVTEGGAPDGESGEERAEGRGARDEIEYRQAREA